MIHNTPFLKYYISKWNNSFARYPEHSTIEEIEAIEKDSYLTTREYEPMLCHGVSKEDAFKKIELNSEKLKDLNDKAWIEKPAHVLKAAFLNDKDFDVNRFKIESDLNFIRWLD